MKLELNHDEAELLARLLRYDLGELRMEIADTDSGRFRAVLHRDEELIKGMLSRLDTAANPVPLESFQTAEPGYPVPGT